MVMEGFKLGMLVVCARANDGIPICVGVGETYEIVDVGEYGVRIRCNCSATSTLRITDYTADCFDLAGGPW